MKGGQRSPLGAGDVGAIGELPAVPTFIRFHVQGGHAGAGDGAGACSRGAASLSTPTQPLAPTPAPPYLAPAAAGTAPHRWHRCHRSRPPARWRRAARPAGRCRVGSVARPHHRTRAGRTRPGAPGTGVQHGAAVRAHSQMSRDPQETHPRERLECQPCQLPVPTHLAVLAAGVPCGTLGPRHQLAGAAVAAGISALLLAEGLQ